MTRIIKTLIEIFQGFTEITALLLYCTVVLPLGYQCRKPASLKKYKDVLDWVKTQNLPLDTAKEIQLPRHLAYITQKGTVHALHSADNRYFVLMKTYILWGRENFLGTLYSEQPLSSSDWVAGYDAECIRIQGTYNCVDEKGVEDYTPNFKELYVSKRHNDCLFEVYFLLN